MTWRQYFQSRSRNPAFLWRMGVSIVLAGMVVGAVVDWVVAEQVDAAGNAVVEKGDDPLDDPSSPVWDELNQLADRGEWGPVWRTVPRAVMGTWRHVGVTTLAALTGMCWLAFATQAIQPRSCSDGRLWLPLIAAALGVLSIWPTVFLIFWQERQWGLVRSELLASGLRFFTLGVGLREEASKFVCFLPLLPWCVRRRDELAALVLAGCVGLGFAMEENVNYIAGSVGTSTLGRLLTSAPFHMAITGLVGLAAYRACLWPKDWAPMLVATFGVAVLAHGLYDALIVLPALQEYSFGAFVIFIGLIYQFFRELRPKQELRVEPISLTANFLFCVAFVAAATFVYLSAAAGVRVAGQALGASIAAQGIMVYLFLREMPETMVEV